MEGAVIWAFALINRVWLFSKPTERYCLKEGIIMVTYDFSPLFRSTVGFDRMTRLLDAAMNLPDHSDGYPPYNIQKISDNAYGISIAVAGFGEDDLEVTAKENTLIVKGKSKDKEKETLYLHRGIAGRAFERTFQLADHIKIVGAVLENGLLSIELEREIPEELKARKIEISTSGSKKLSGKAA